MIWKRKDKSVSVSIYQGVLDAVFDECDKYDSHETGGRLIGTFTRLNEKLAIEVSGVIEPGPAARRTATSFFQDGAYQEGVFRSIEERHPEIEHLGNWHTHHVNGYPHLSSGDVTTYQRTVNHDNHNTDFFYALLVTEKTSNALQRYQVRHYLLRRGDSRVYEIPDSEIQIINKQPLWPIKKVQHTSPEINVYRSKADGNEERTQDQEKTSMKVITVNVGQGSLTIVRHNNEALIVDSRIPPSDDETVAFVKEILAVSLKGHFVKGLILTGFDSDHSDISGVSIILKKYRPDWVMYPKYFKDSDEAKLVFKLIKEQEKLRQNSANPLTRISVRLDQLNARKLKGLSTNFDVELFSPHIEDMDSSNNCSIVLKVTGVGPKGFSYLITGDTENERWETISRLFTSSLKSDVMAAPHHGSKNGTHPASLLHIQPHTVLISAGVDNQYGHPDPQALKVYAGVADEVYSTNMEGGVSLMTSRKSATFETKLISN